MPRMRQAGNSAAVRRGRVFVQGVRILPDGAKPAAEGASASGESKGGDSKSSEPKSESKTESKTEGKASAPKPAESKSGGASKPDK